MQPQPKKKKKKKYNSPSPYSPLLLLQLLPSYLSTPLLDISAASSTIISALRNTHSGSQSINVCFREHYLIVNWSDLEGRARLNLSIFFERPYVFKSFFRFRIESNILSCAFSAHQIFITRTWFWRFFYHRFAHFSTHLCEHITRGKFHQWSSQKAFNPRQYRYGSMIHVRFRVTLRN